MTTAPIATEAPAARAGDRRWRALAAMAAVDVLVMGLWFTASYVVPALRAEWHLDAAGSGALTASVQLGFVTGALFGAIFNVPDRVAPGRLIGAAAATATLATVVFGLFAASLAAALPLRFITGAALALVYPPSMKVAASWFSPSQRGIAIGTIIGALTLGSASPLLLGLFPLPWRVAVLVSAALAAAGTVLATRSVNGPFAAPGRPVFDVRAAVRVQTHRSTLLASLGYYGHMWELYAFWAWLPAFLAAGALAGAGNGAVRLLSFTVIGIFGLAGSLAGGLIADRRGRTVTTAAAMAISGGIALLSPALFGAPAVLVAVVAAIWGAAVIADSGQFSAAMSELSEPAYVGTALTLQTSIGFFVSAITVQLTPQLASAVGWRWALAYLAIGPALGAASMLLLRRDPESTRMAGGRR